MFIRCIVKEDEVMMVATKGKNKKRSHDWIEYEYRSDWITSKSTQKGLATVIFVNYVIHMIDDINDTACH